MADAEVRQRALLPAHSGTLAHVTWVDNLCCWEPAGSLTRWGHVLPCKNSHDMPGKGFICPHPLAEIRCGCSCLQALDREHMTSPL